MPKPSLLQTLLREPSRTYSQTSSNSSEYDHSSSRRGTSLRSVSSYGSSSSFQSSLQRPVSLNEPAPRQIAPVPRQNGGAWEWSVFGGRKGLTGGPASLRAPSVIFSGDDEGKEEDTRSLKSARSLGSIGSASVQRSREMRGNSASWTQGEAGLLGAEAKVKKKSKHGTSRRYSSDIVTAPQMPEDRVRRHSTLSYSSSSSIATSLAASTTSTSPHVATSNLDTEPTEVVPRKKRRRPKVDSPLSGSDISIPSLTSDASTTTSTSSGPTTPTVTSAATFTPEEKGKVYPKRSFILEPVDEGLEGEEDRYERRRSLVALHEAAPIPIEDNAIEHGIRTEANETALSSVTRQHLDGFAAGSPVMVEPIVGKLYSMDEIFSSRPLAPRATVPIESSSPTPETVSGTSSLPSDANLIVNSDFLPEVISTPYPSTSSIHPTLTAPPESPPRPSQSLPAFKRISMDLPSSSATSSEISFLQHSSLLSTTDISSVATTEASHATGAETLSEVPVIKLTRTRSDQVALGLMGDVEIPACEIGAGGIKKRRKSSSSSISPAPPRPEISSERKRSLPLASSPPTSTLRDAVDSDLSTTIPASSPTKLTSANLATTPQGQHWLKKVRELSGPSELSPLSTANVPPRRSKSVSTKLETARIPNYGPLAPRTTSLPAVSNLGRSHSSGGSSTVSDSTGSQGRRTQSVQLPRTSAPPPEAIVIPSAPTVLPPSLLPLPQLSAHAIEHLGLTYSFPPPAGGRRRANSVLSDVASDRGKSDAGRSTRSVPVEVYRPATSVIASSQRDSIALSGSKSTMFALSIAATAGVKSRFTFFKKSTAREDRGSGAGRIFDAGRDLTFGQLQPPPKKLRSTEVLVRVLAVGLDSWDMERVVERAGKPEGFGWVPGRSFCGRVLECGAEVSRIKRGELVYGLNDLKKSGALAQLLAVEKDFVAVAPECGLSVEHIASLPLVGVSSIQVMQTVCKTLPKGSKILIIDAGEGVGDMCIQLAAHFRETNDLWITAQCLPSVRDGVSKCKASGASEVLVDEPLAVINRLHESSFDVVIDTLGGRRLYEASRRILHFEGTFVTTVGDELTVANAELQWKTGIRSLKRTFFKKDKKAVRYWAVHLDRREHVRETLDTLRAAVVHSGVRVPVSEIFPFEQASKAFGTNQMGSGTTVKVLGI